MRVQVRINFNTNVSASLTTHVLPAGVNVSKADKVPLQANQGYKGFQLSPTKDRVVSALDGTYNFYPFEGYEGILTRTLSDDNAEFTSPPTIIFTLSGYNIKNLYLTFDHKSNEYAEQVQISIDDVSWTVDNVLATTTMGINFSSHYEIVDNVPYEISISITKWSKPNASAKITQISWEYEDTFSSDSILSFTCSENAFNEQVFVQPGIVEQYAEINLYDRYKRIHMGASEDLLLNAAEVKIVLIADDGTEALLGSYLADNWDITSTSADVNVVCNDPSVTFDKIFVENLPVQNRSLDQTLTTLFSYASKYTWKYQDAGTKAYCQLIRTPNSWFKAGSLSDLLQKACTLGLLRIYWSKNTFVVMRCI